jgi:hypothetical protein
MDTISLALYGWPLVAIILFARLRQKHWALIWTFLLGVLFLPEIQMASVSPQAPDPNSFKAFIIVKSTKPNTIAFSALIGVLLFDSKRLFSFRPRWFDIPMLVWCVVPMISDILIPESEPKRPTLYDSFSASRDQVWFYGIAYYLGRVYFRDVEKIRDLAVSFVYGALIYCPLFLYEAKFQTGLHDRWYGFFPGDAGEAFRAGGFRPVLFMSHGLATSLYMWAAAIAGVWLWWSGAVKKLKLLPNLPPVSMAWVAGLLMVMAILTRSTGAILLGLACLAALFQLRWIRQPILLIFLLLYAPVKMPLRATVQWQDPTQQKREVYDPNTAPLLDHVMAALTSWENVKDRKASLAFRELNENYLIRKIWDAPFLGYGDTGLGTSVDELKTPENRTGGAVTDSFWIITLTAYGAVGLVAIYVAMLLPVARYIYYYKPYRWDQALYAPGAALSLIVMLWMLDNLFNGFFNAMYVLSAGALFSVTGNIRARPKGPPAAQPVRDVKPLGPPPAARAGVLRRGRPMSK